jgi:hypothetical protein
MPATIKEIVFTSLLILQAQSKRKKDKKIEKVSQ